MRYTRKGLQNKSRLKLFRKPLNFLQSQACTKQPHFFRKILKGASRVNHKKSISRTKGRAYVLKVSELYTY